MTFTFRPAKRENVPLLIGIAGGTGSGKTYSALRLARGIAGGHPFAGIDTENGRMNHYADTFPELHIAPIRAPFRPEKYSEAIDAGTKYLAEQGVPAGSRVVVVDSMSHEWAGDGGCLDWHDEITKGDKKKSPQAWATIKPAHKRMVTRLLQVEAHVVVCLRAEEKIDIVRENGELKFVPKRALTGLDGWMPITEKNLPFELTASLLLMADTPGVPRPIKLEEQHRAMVPLDAPITEDTGRALAAWAAGSAGPALTRGGGGVGTDARSPDASSPAVSAELFADELADELIAVATELGAGEATAAKVIENRDSAMPREKYVAWLTRQLATAKTNLEQRRAEEAAAAVAQAAQTTGESAAEQESMFAAMVPAEARREDRG
jgi:hypothetical protein